MCALRMRGRQVQQLTVAAGHFHCCLHVCLRASVAGADGRKAHGQQWCFQGSPVRRKSATSNGRLRVLHGCVLGLEKLALPHET
jgi:hypothetical protein